MTLAQAIAAEPYLKIANCTDIADINYAIDILRKLDAKYGENNKTLLKLWAKFLDKKAKMQA
jgi:UDP-N-acetylglucosamine enolpyruvyl transferase